MELVLSSVLGLTPHEPISDPSLCKESTPLLSLLLKEVMFCQPAVLNWEKKVFILFSVPE